MGIENDIITVLSLFYFAWIYSWAKSKFGSAKLAVLFAVIIVYLTFFMHPELVWIPVIIFIFATFGKEFFEQAKI